MPSPIVAVRVPHETHRILIDRATTNGTTVTDLLRELIEQGLNQTHGQAIPKP